MKKQKHVIVILIVLLVVAIGYIAYNQIQDYNDEQAKKIYMAGVENGYESAVKQVFEEAVNCQLVTVHADNESIEMIDINCLNQPTIPLPEE